MMRLKARCEEHDELVYGYGGWDGDWYAFQLVPFSEAGGGYIRDLDHHSIKHMLCDLTILGKDE